MKIHTQKTRFTGAAAAVIILALGVSACQMEPDSPTGDSPADTSVSPQAPGNTDPESYENPFPASSNESIAWEALVGPDGEYAAAASYQAVLDEYGQVEPYASILEGEKRHIAALTRQLEQLGVDVPQNPYLGNIEAPSDLVTAAQAWAEGEVKNVEMYDRLIADATDESLIRVLTNLRRASLESHLPAFEQAAENGGTLDSWTPSHSSEG